MDELMIAALSLHDIAFLYVLWTWLFLQLTLCLRNIHFNCALAARADTEGIQRVWCSRTHTQLITDTRFKWSLRWTQVRQSESTSGRTVISTLLWEAGRPSAAEQHRRLWSEPRPYRTHFIFCDASQILSLWTMMFQQDCCYLSVSESFICNVVNNHNERRNK